MVACPKCNGAITLPEGADPNATFSCPLCQASYPLSEARLDTGPDDAPTLFDLDEDSKVHPDEADGDGDDASGIQPLVGGAAALGALGAVAKGADALRDSLSDKGGELASDLKENLTSRLTDTVSDVVDSAKETVADLPGAIADVASSAADGDMDFARDGIESVSEMVRDGLDDGDLTTSEGAPQDADSDDGAGVNPLLGGAAALAAMGAVAKGIDAITDKIEDAVDRTGEAGKDILEGGKDAVTAGKEAVGDAVDSGVDVVKGAVSSTKETVSDLTDSIVNRFDWDDDSSVKQAELDSDELGDDQIDDIEFEDIRLNGIRHGDDQHDDGTPDDSTPDDVDLDEIDLDEIDLGDAIDFEDDGIDLADDDVVAHEGMAHDDESDEEIARAAEAVLASDSGDIVGIEDITPSMVDDALTADGLTDEALTGDVEPGESPVEVVKPFDLEPNPDQIPARNYRPGVPRSGGHLVSSFFKFGIGGILGLLLAQAGLWWIGRIDPLSLAGKLPTAISFIAPASLRSSHADPVAVAPRATQPAEAIPLPTREGVGELPAAVDDNGRNGDDLTSETGFDPTTDGFDADSEPTDAAVASEARLGGGGDFIPDQTEGPAETEPSSNLMDTEFGSHGPDDDASDFESFDNDPIDNDSFGNDPTDNDPIDNDSFENNTFDGASLNSDSLADDPLDGNSLDGNSLTSDPAASDLIDGDDSDDRFTEDNLNGGGLSDAFLASDDLDSVDPTGESPSDPVLGLATQRHLHRNDLSMALGDANRKWDAFLAATASKASKETRRTLVYEFYDAVAQLGDTAVRIDADALPVVDEVHNFMKSLARYKTSMGKAATRRLAQVTSNGVFLAGHVLDQQTIGNGYQQLRVKLLGDAESRTFDVITDATTSVVSDTDVYVLGCRLTDPASELSGFPNAAGGRASDGGIVWSDQIISLP